MKAKARDIIETYYADAVKPFIADNLNSDQYRGVVTEKVKVLLEQLTFLIAPELDDQVWFYLHCR